MATKEDTQNITGTVMCALIVIFLATAVPYRIISSENQSVPLQLNNFRYIGPPLILVGIVGYILCFLNFINDAKGTPLPGGTQEHLIVTGLYQYVRNPIYISWFLIIFGEAVFFESVAMFYYLLAWMVFFHFKVIIFEEPSLQKRFGESYQQYCKSVHRWIPRFTINDEESK
jgi:protein-S-isoprenylcysteine O-methyltransferase Ste14